MHKNRPAVSVPFNHVLGLTLSATAKQAAYITIPEGLGSGGCRYSNSNELRDKSELTHFPRVSKFDNGVYNHSAKPAIIKTTPKLFG